MIAGIHLRNFKRFRDLTLTGRPLTVLTGANGAGKTSVLHSLLLARQMARQPDRTHVELNGVDTLELGGAEDVIHHEASDNLAAVQLTDNEGKVRLWSFRAPGTDDARTLNAIVVDRPQGDPGALAGPAPHFSYLCAERLGPRDVLSASAASTTELDVGPRGEFVAQVLSSFGRSRVSEARLQGSTTKTGVADLLHQTENWMTNIVRPVEIDAEWFPNTSITRLRFKSPGLRTEWTRAPNSGFGISYALPIVVAALRAETGGLLLIENPEAHLHPAGQSRIGGFLAQVAADGVQVFLETHSDHVLNGIRIAVATGVTTLAPDRAIVHFFRSEDDGGPVLQSIELGRTGQLSTWPAGFFDQTQADLATLAATRRRKP